MKPQPFRVRARDRNLWEELPVDARLWAARQVARQGFVLDEVIKGLREQVDATVAENADEH